MINIFETSFEARERRFQIEKLYHGETVDLVGVVTTNGVPQNITGYAVSGVFQPTSAQGSDDFYDLSADIVDNKVVVHWDKGKDFGENSYMVWALLTDGDNASYPIVWRLDMAYSPNFPLSSLAPIPKAIDFSKYDLLNAPWLPLSDVQSVKEDVLLSVSEHYLPLSGGTIDGGLVVTSDISAENFTASIAKGVSIGDSSVSDNGVVIGFNSGTSHGSVAIGNGIESDGFGNTNIGLTSKSKGDFGIAIGQATEVSSIGIAIGYDSKAVVPGAVAIGTSAKATAKNAIQIGSTVDDESSWTEQVNSVPHSLKVMDKMVLSGDNLTLDPERVPYLSNYETKEDAATEHQTLSADLTAYVDEKISEIPVPEPPPVAGVLTIKQNESVVVEYNPDDETDITATITVPDVPTDLSAFENSPGFATSAYVQEYVDEHSGGDYLPLSGGNLSGRIYLETTTTSSTVVPGETVTVMDTSVLKLSSFEEGAGAAGEDLGLSVQINASFADMFEGSAPLGSVEYSVWCYENGVQKYYNHGFLYPEFGDPEDPSTFNYTYSVQNDYDNNGHADMSLYAVEDDINGGPTGALRFSAHLYYDPTLDDETGDEIEPGYDQQWNHQSDLPTDLADNELAEKESRWFYPTTETVGPPTTEEVEVTVEDPFVLSSELTAAIGDINSILDNINGEII